MSELGRIVINGDFNMYRITTHKMKIHGPDLVRLLISTVMPGLFLHR